MLRLEVPASSANLGPGFDALGLALDIRLSVTAEQAGRDSFDYTGAGPAPLAQGNLVHRGYAAVYAAVGKQRPPVAFTLDNPIPLARGLGSSSAALVAGAAAADAFLGEPLGREGVFRVTAALEGHPDNVGPAVFGGFVVAAADANGEFVARSLPVPNDWRLLFGVPAFELQTIEARAALPASYDPAQTVLTSSRAALWVAAVATGDRSLLRVASLDVMHQPYRARLVPGLAPLLTELRSAGADAAYLSGAGPTVGVIVGASGVEAARYLLSEWVGADGQVLAPEATTGYTVERC